MRACSEGLVIEGEAKLLEHPEFSDVDRMRQLIHALGERETIVALLDATIACEDVQIFVGSEAGDLVGGHLSVVGGAVHRPGARRGHHRRARPDAHGLSESRAARRGDRRRDERLVAAGAARGQRLRHAALVQRARELSAAVEIKSAMIYESRCQGRRPSLPGSPTAESPVDRALALSLADEKDTALRWAAAIVAADPTMPSGCS